MIDPRLHLAVVSVAMQWQSFGRLRYSDNEWGAIVALLPAPARANDHFRLEIESCAARIARPDTQLDTDAQWIAAWHQVANAVEELWDALAVVDEGEPRHSVASHLTNLLAEAEGNIESVHKSPSPRRKNHKPEISELVRRLLVLWCHCGGEPKLSRGAPGAVDDGQIRGPLIRFLFEATKPIFSACEQPPLSADQLAYQIRKARRLLRRPAA